MLKLSTIDFHYCVWVAIEDLCRSFNHASFAGSGRSQKQHSADRPVWRIHTRKKNLVKTAHAADGTFLSHNAGGKPFLKVLSTRALLIRIQEDCPHIIHVFWFRYLHFS